MDWLELGLSVLTLLLGGGWFVTYKSHKKEKEGEAAQAEAGGWKAQQEVYQATISDLKDSCDYIRADRNLLREENVQLREENKAYRDKISELEAKVQTLQDDVARQGRRIELLIKELESKRSKTTKKPKK